MKSSRSSYLSLLPPSARAAWTYALVLLPLPLPPALSAPEKGIRWCLIWKSGLLDGLCSSASTACMQLSHDWHHHGLYNQGLRAWHLPHACRVWSKMQWVVMTHLCSCCGPLGAFQLQVSHSLRSQTQSSSLSWNGWMLRTWQPAFRVTAAPQHVHADPGHGLAQSGV